MEKYFFEAFENMDRLGPGSENSTLDAVKHIDITRKVKILDIGCGVGTHTFLLANKITNAEIIAIDNSQNFIDKFNKSAKLLKLDDRVKGICMSMFEMTFEDNSFDYIFAEGSIYIAGFTNGLSDWKRLLKKDGLIICSEISWTSDNPSPKVKDFWANNYPQMDNITNKIAQAEDLGYKLIEYFPLAKEAWTDNYYIPLQKNINSMKTKYIGDETALEVIDIIQEEIDIYSKFNSEYNYVFYVLQARSN